LSDHTSAAAANAGPGDQVAGYRLEEQIGQGGMAVVYRAHDERLNRRVAIKLLAPGLTSDTAFRARFVRESQAAASVDHPNIIPVYGAGDADGFLYIAMRYVQGGDVRSLISEGNPLSPARVWNIITQVGSALDAAHAHDLVHRDVKPANMLLDANVATTGAKGKPSDDQRDHVYLSDFGISKQSLAVSNQTLASHLTSTGQFVGTLDYIAPEQIEGVALDGRADQYALACTAFELLTGVPPFLRNGGLALINAHLSEQPPSALAKRPELPAAVDRVLAKAMAKSADLRYDTCAEFAADLGRALGLLPGQAGVAQPTAAATGKPHAATEVATPMAMPEPTQAVSPGQIAAATPPPPPPMVTPVIQPPVATPTGADAATMAAVQAPPPPAAAPGTQQGPPGQFVWPGQATAAPQQGTYPQAGPQPGAYPQGTYPQGTYPQGTYPQQGAYPQPSGPYQQYPQQGGPTNPQGWPPPQYPQPAKRSKGTLVGAVVGTVVVVAAVAVVAVVLTSKNSSTNGPNPPPNSSTVTTPPVTSTQTTPPVTTQANTAQSEASAINNVLAFMANSRTQLGVPSQEVTGCSNLSSAVSQIQSVASNRQNQLASAQTLPVGLLPNGGTLKAQLLAALRVSLRADRDYISWGEDEESGGCGSGYGPALALNSVNPQATASKEALTGTWDPIAPQFGLPQYSASQI
jgi:tRNA A-37 threonylcarbamoyl transferase component Bud32